MDFVDQIIRGLWLLAIVLTCFILLIIWLRRKWLRRSRDVLQDWASQRGLKIVWARHFAFSNGPFNVVFPGQVTYRIEVVDKTGRH
jgi:hypothetical protein